MDLLLLLRRNEAHRAHNGQLCLLQHLLGSYAKPDVFRLLRCVRPLSPHDYIAAATLPSPLCSHEFDQAYMTAGQRHTPRRRPRQQRSRPSRT